MKTLVIAEKPSVGRDIARVLQCTRNSQGALEGEKYIVTWALGHLVTWQIRKDMMRSISHGGSKIFR